MVATYRQSIGGELVDSASGKTLDVLNPARDEVIATVPASDREDVDRAANAAAKAFEARRETTPQDSSLGGAKESGRGTDGSIHALEDRTLVGDVWSISAV